jgi:ABC-type Fe3+/spermidine/putrescine transport system ATPase subunit
VKDGEYMVVVGPSGAGKTVLLESIAGLFPLKDGEIWLRGKDVTWLKPEERHVSIVYQDHALFPHLSVRENIVFGLCVHKTTPERTQEALTRVVDLFGISPLLHRRPTTLSGGERQKVALARALCVSPDVLLLDEPLSSLDPLTREEIEAELQNLHRVFKVTTLHVTHNFEEAVSLGERIAVIGEGEVRQVGTPEEIFRRPNSEFVARFAMSRNIFRGELGQSTQKYRQFKTDGIIFAVENSNGGGNRAVIRPEDVMLSPLESPSNGANVFPGKITRMLDKGSTLQIDIDLPPAITALATRHMFHEMRLEVGMQINVSFEASSVHIFQEN